MSAELWRALGALASPPGPTSDAIARALDLGPAPSRADHTELFVLQLPPYASIYLGAGGMLGGEARDRVAGFWRAVGRRPPAEPDHLALLLGLLAALADEGRNDPLAAHARDTLVREHLLPWVPAWLVKAREQAPPFYRRWAALLEEALGEAARKVGDAGQALPSVLEAAITADAEARSGHARGQEAGGAAPGDSAADVQPTGDPLAGDPPDDLPRFLTTPVRSGLILTRADLAQAARSRGLPVRIGERRFALDAMLGAAPSETLGWLAEEADAWAERHRAWAPLDPASARWWEERARRTGESVAGLRGNRGRSALV